MSCELQGGLSSGSGCGSPLGEQMENIFILLHLLLSGWSRECLVNWGSFIWLAVPGMVMMCIEWWTFEIGSFLAGESKSSFPFGSWWPLLEHVPRAPLGWVCRTLQVFPSIPWG